MAEAEWQEVMVWGQEPRPRAAARASSPHLTSPHLTSPCLCPCLAPPRPEPEQGKVSLAPDGRVPRQVGVLGHLRSTAELTLASYCLFFSEQVSLAHPCWRLSSGVTSQKAAQHDASSKPWALRPSHFGSNPKATGFKVCDLG